VLFITTDGIIEAGSVRGERYGKERVQRSVSEYRDYNAETMVQRAYASLNDFVSGAIDDDVTLMALKYGAQ
jgi:serine phosphatase RsbU (regulator of sigma subunit)